jgi:hypothetical protein
MSSSIVPPERERLLLSRPPSLPRLSRSSSASPLLACVMGSRHAVADRRTLLLADLAEALRNSYLLSIWFSYSVSNYHFSGVRKFDRRNDGRGEIDKLYVQMR